MIRILDENYDPFPDLDDATLVWHEVYYGAGQFQLEIARRLDSSAMYVYNTDKEQLGIILARDESMTDKCTYSGSLYLHKLNEHVIYENHTYKNQTPEYIVKDLVSKYAPGVIIEASQNLGTPINEQVQGRKLEEYVTELLEKQQLSAALDFDYLTKAVTFRVWQGNDDTINKVPLSTDFETISDMHVLLDISNYANVAYVGGEVIEGQARKVVKVDQSGAGREIDTWVDSSDLTKTTQDEAGQETTLTDAEYEAVLANAGVKALEALKPKIQIPFNSFGEYELGQKRLLKDNGLMLENRVTEIMTSYQEGGVEVAATFGEQYLKNGGTKQ